MKRTAIKTGRKSLDRGSTFQKRRAALNRVAVPKVHDRERSEAWHRGAQAKGCALCGALGVDAHHVVTKQKIREVAPKLGRDVDSLLWDTRNRLPLCRRHHGAHHSRAHPVPWAVLEQHAPKAAQFAREIGLDWWIEIAYPKGAGS